MSGKCECVRPAGPPVQVTVLVPGGSTREVPACAGCAVRSGLGAAVDAGLAAVTKTATKDSRR